MANFIFTKGRIADRWPTLDEMNVGASNDDWNPDLYLDSRLRCKAKGCVFFVMNETHQGCNEHHFQCPKCFRNLTDDDHERGDYICYGCRYG